MIHESGAWSDIHQKWFFLPRRCSKEQYNETKDESMSCNVMLIADETFMNIKVINNYKKIFTYQSIEKLYFYLFLGSSRWHSDANQRIFKFQVPSWFKRLYNCSFEN